MPAELAVLSGRLISQIDFFHLPFGIFQLLGKRPVELAQHLDPRGVSFCDLVEFVFHVGGEPDIQNVREVLHQQVVDNETDLGGRQPLVHALDVTARLDGGDDWCVSTGPADAVFFERSYQRCFRVSGRGLGEMLFGEQFQQVQNLSFGQRWEDVPFVRVWDSILIRFLLVQSEKTLEFDRGTRCPEQVGMVSASGGVAGPDVHGDRVQHRRRHLAGDEALPDQRIEPVLVPVQVVPDALRCPEDRCRPDRFVGLLRGFGAGLVEGWLLGHVFVTVVAGDVFPRLVLCLPGHIGRVSTHIGDETDRVALAQRDTLVQRLGGAHRLFGGEAQSSRRLLLHGAGGVWWRGVSAPLTLLDLEDGVHGLLELSDDGLRVHLVFQIHILVMDTQEVSLEGGRQFLCGCFLFGEQRIDRPVLDGDEVLDLPFPVDDEAHRDGLNPSSGQTAAHFVPQQRADFVSNQAVQYPAGLLGVHQIHVDVPPMRKCFSDRIFGDLVKHDTLCAVSVDLGCCHQVPGDGLPFPVGVGCQVHFGGLVGVLAQLLDDLALLVGNPVVGREAVIDVHRKPRTQQVTNVPDGCLHAVAVAQKPSDGARFCGRLDDDQFPFPFFRFGFWTCEMFVGGRLAHAEHRPPTFRASAAHPRSPCLRIHGFRLLHLILFATFHTISNNWVIRHYCPLAVLQVVFFVLSLELGDDLFDVLCT